MFKSAAEIDQHRVRFLKRFGINSTKEFQDTIKEAREFLGYSYYDMSNYLGCATSTTIYRWEKGVSVPHNRTVLERLIEKNVLVPRA